MDGCGVDLKHEGVAQMSGTTTAFLAAGLLKLNARQGHLHVLPLLSLVWSPGAPRDSGHVSRTLFLLTSEARETSRLILYQKPLCCVFPSFKLYLWKFCYTVGQLGLTGFHHVRDNRKQRCQLFVTLQPGSRRPGDRAEGTQHAGDGWTPEPSGAYSTQLCNQCTSIGH